MKHDIFFYSQFLTTVGKGIADSETIVHSASWLGAAEIGEGRHLYSERDLGKEMLFCIIATDLQ